ncbi:sulfite exporter TauE/SafE family protein [Gemmatimonadota bacterium]
MVEQRILRALWGLSILVLAVVLITATFFRESLFDINLSTGSVIFLSLAVMAFFAEYVDSSIGMGYGTTLTPILLIIGYEPLDIVPAILLSEFLSGTTAGFLHHRLGNVDFKKGSQSRKIAIVLTSWAVVGTIIAVFLAINLPKQIIKLYIGLMIFAMGLIMLVNGSRQSNFSWRRISLIGGMAAFNKGISGGGFGPLVTGGQIISGVSEKKAVGITSLVEGLVCLVGLILYLATRGGLNMMLAGALITGAIISTPVATRTVKVLPDRIIRRAVGYATVALGMLTLFKLM